MLVSGAASQTPVAVVAGRHTVTANGDVQHSTAQSKFGASSIRFDGTGDYLTIPNSSDWDFGTGDFTIEFWARLDNASVRQYYMSNGDVPSGTKSLAFKNQENRRFKYLPSTTGSSYDLEGYGGGPDSTINNTWQHYAFVRYGTSWKPYVDGTLGYSNRTSSSALYTSQNQLTIGAIEYTSGFSELMTGYMDEIRISDNARYTSNFTPPTSAFTVDGNTKLLIHSDTTNGSTTFVGEGHT